MKVCVTYAHGSTESRGGRLCQCVWAAERSQVKGSQSGYPRRLEQVKDGPLQRGRDGDPAGIRVGASDPGGGA